jgi:hypothetical protein
VLLRAVIASFVLSGGMLIACNDTPSHPPAVAKQTADYVPIDADSLCHLYTTDCPEKTGQTLEQCTAIYKAVRVSPACKDQLNNLTCANANSGVENCWPACSGVSAQCDGDHIIECAPSGRTFTYDCTAVCGTQNKAWSGSCGTSYEHQTSSVPTCWCN